MVWGGCIWSRKGTRRSGRGTHRTSDGSITGDGPDLLLLRGPNLRSVGVDPILNVVVCDRWNVPVQRGEDVTRGLASCQSLVCDMPRQLHFSRRATGMGLRYPYPVMRGTLVYLPCNSSRSG